MRARLLPSAILAPGHECLFWSFATMTHFSVSTAKNYSNQQIEAGLRKIQKNLKAYKYLLLLEGTGESAFSMPYGSPPYSVPISALELAASIKAFQGLISLGTRILLRLPGIRDWSSITPHCKSKFKGSHLTPNCHNAFGSILPETFHSQQSPNLHDFADVQAVDIAVLERPDQARYSYAQLQTQKFVGPLMSTMYVISGHIQNTRSG